MTDIYIRRSDGPNVRKRAVLFILCVALVVGGIFLLFRKGCSPSPGVEAPPVEAPPAEENETETLVEDLLRIRSSTGDVATTSSAPDSTTQDAVASAGGKDPGVLLITEAQRLHAEDKLLEARDKALTILKHSIHEPARKRAQALLSSVNVRIALTPHESSDKEPYVVQSGDSLAKLAKKFSTTIEFIQKGNQISGSLIRVGDRLRIWKTPFRVNVDKSDNILDVHTGDVFFKRYQVGTGEYNRTPVGDFTITGRIAQPTWWHEDGRAIPYGSDDNQLGTHWLSLSAKGYGIHGTWEPDTIGKQASEGCIRLLNEDIEELYTLLPLGTPVTIQD